MAAMSTQLPTLLDLSKRLTPEGSVDTKVVEILNETNEILDDMAWSEGNLATGDLTTMRTGIPRPTWRRLNEGVQPSKSTTRQVTFNCGSMEAFGEVDVKLVKINNNSAAWRLSEEKPQIEGFAQELAETIIYGNEGSEPAAFTGIMPYFNSLSAESADNIIDAGGTGTDNASILLVVWGENVKGIVPKGSMAGLSIKDLGEVTIENANGVTGARMQALRTHYVQDAGLAMRDWRYVVRICNIDKSLLSLVWTSGAFSTGANLPNLMFQAMRKVKNLNAGRAAFYMSRDIATTVAQQTAAMGNNVVTADTISGDKRFTERFHGIPMRRVDAMSADESRVV